MTKLITSKISPANHRKIHSVAKEHGLPIMVLSTMLLEAGLEDLISGRIKITKPSILKAGKERSA